MESTFRTFKNLADAMAYRFENGTGGWIFCPDCDYSSKGNPLGAETILFPPEYTASRIFSNKLTGGLSGRLICN